MNTYRFEGSDIHFSFPYSPEILGEIKWISGASWNPSLKEWVVPILNATEETIVDFMERFDFQERDTTLKKAEQKLTFKPIDYAHIEGKLSMLDLCFQPRDYQKEAIAYGLQKRAFINGQDMGLGKTFSSIVTTELDRSFPCLVITPASVKYNFANEWTKYTGRQSVSIIETKETKKRKNNWDADVVVINYDILGKLVDNGRTNKAGKTLKDLELRFPQLFDREWKSIICDEAHFLKNKETARSQSVKKIIKSIEFRQFLTGTAVMNKPKEIINLLRLLGKFEHIADDWMDFVYTYCGAKREYGRWNYDGATNVIELNQKLRDTCYIRHEKRDVLTELPDVTRTVLETPLSNSKEYSKALNNLYGYLLDNGGVEKAMAAGEAEHLVMINTLRQLAIKGKMKAIEQYLKDFAEGDEKLIVFGLHREPLQHLSKKFKGDLIAGGVSAKKKYDIVQDFKTNDKQFLFANMQSAGTGTDGLQDACSNMLIIELPWTIALLEQTIARLDRDGQKFATGVNFMLDNTSIDGDMWLMLEEKEMIADGVNKGIDVEAEKVGMKKVLKKILENVAA